MTLGNRIRSYRKAAGLSRDELAYRLGVTEPEIAEWEKNLTVPDEKYTDALCDALGISDDELFPPETDAAENIAVVKEELQSDQEQFSEVSLKIVTPIEELLEDGERLIWAGKPSVKLRLGTAGGTLISSAVWVVITSAWFFSSAFSFPPLMALGIPLICYGLYRTLGGVLSLRKQKASVSYAITNCRVIIKCDYKQETVKSIYLNEIQSIRFAEGRDGTGTIIFSDKPMDDGASGRQGFPGFPGFISGLKKSSSRLPLDGLYDIPDVNTVCDIFRNML